MIAKIEDAKKDKQKSLVVFITNRSHHKDNIGTGGISVNDLKPKFLEAYKHLLCNFNLSTRLVSMNDYAVEWIVKF
jgi:hypothetical protein